MTGRRLSMAVPAPAGGWVYPWPSVAEIEAVLASEHWTLIGGLMVQLHAIHHGIDPIRPTNDIDLVVHVETGRGRPQAVADALNRLGYQLQEPVDPRNRTAHRFRRDTDTVDLVTSARAVDGAGDVVDVLVADHAAPSVRERLLGYDMVAIEGATQALRRTVNATLSIEPVRETRLSVPDPYGALILKSAAHQSDNRDRERHLLDAAVLLACIDDPYDELAREPSGSDHSRLRHLHRHLGDPRHPAWLSLTAGQGADAQSALEILTAP